MRRFGEVLEQSGKFQTSVSGKRPGVNGGTMKPISATPSSTICACCCGARPSAPFGNNSICTVPPEASFTAAANGFLTVLKSRSVSGENTANFNLIGWASASDIVFNATAQRTNASQ